MRTPNPFFRVLTESAATTWAGSLFLYVPLAMSSAPFNDFIAEVQKQYRMDWFSWFSQHPEDWVCAWPTITSQHCCLFCLKILQVKLIYANYTSLNCVHSSFMQNSSQFRRCATPLHLCSQNMVELLYNITCLGVFCVSLLSVQLQWSNDPGCWLTRWQMRITSPPVSQLL